MYAFLVILGVVVAVAGVAIAVPGLPLAGRDFDASIITPGAVAIVGGLVLIALGLAVRVLSRIEKALAAGHLARPVVHQDEAAAVALVEAAELPVTAPVPTPMVAKPVSEPRP